MITREVGDQYWLTTQTDHAAVAGHLASYWGNREFCPPERFLRLSNHEKELRDEVLAAVAGHEDGWRERPEETETDHPAGIPPDFTEVPLRKRIDRWRAGVAHHADRIPFAALLISRHAYWIFASQCDPSMDPKFLHPVIRPEEHQSPPARDAAARMSCQFIREQEKEQNKLLERLRQDMERRRWIAPSTLNPNVRLLQLVDAMALQLSFGAEATLTLVDVPRRRWEDHVQLQFTVEEDRRALVSPYPFAEDPLIVPLTLRRIGREDAESADSRQPWKEIPPAVVHFEFTSGDGAIRDAHARNAGQRSFPA